MGKTETKNEPTLTLHQGDDYAVIMRPGETTDNAFILVKYPSKDEMALLKKMAGAPDVLTKVKALLDAMPAPRSRKATGPWLALMGSIDKSEGR